MKIEFKQIGVIHTPFIRLEGMPVQPAGAGGVSGTVEIFGEYREGLKDLDGFSHVILLYYFHRSQGFDLSIIPFMDTEPHGLFATRAPRRPNQIGMSVVQLDMVEDAILHVRNVDVLDGTPLFDIKPYFPEFEGVTGIRYGWLEKSGKTARETKADDRFK